MSDGLTPDERLAMRPPGEPEGRRPPTATRARLEAMQPVLMVRDVAASLRFYARLGFAQTFQDAPSDPKYAGVRRDGIELHLQWHDAVEWAFPNDRPTYRFVVSDVDAFSRELDALGAELDRTPPTDTGWGTRELHVRDPDGNGLQFYRARGEAARSRRRIASAEDAKVVLASGPSLSPDDASRDTPE